MMNSVKTKKESPSTYINNIKPVITLSDRLRIAGIKEYKPNIDTKPVKNSNNNFRKRKSTFKITSVRNRGNSSKDFSSKQSNKNEAFQSKTKPKNISNSSPKLKKPINTSSAKTISESLNFIKDCQNYKTKLRNPKEELQIEGNEPIEKPNDSQSETQPVIREEECEKSPKKILTSTIPKEKPPISLVAEEKVSVLPVSEEKIIEKSCADENSTFQKNNNDKLFTKEIVKIPLKSSVEEITNICQKQEIIPENLLLDVSKIDKKYLESILSLAKSPDESKNKTSKENDNVKERKKKSTGKPLINTNVKNQNEINSKNNSESNQIRSQSKKEQRIVRDLTKSDAQIQLRDKKHGSQNQKNSETKMEKDLIHFKLEISDGRKKRKPRKKSVKNTNEEVIEVPFSFENSKSNDVRELWRRETLKKSENSLTSHSSCTVPENDVIPNWKNLELQSYRILQKLVEEEINKISKKSESKNNTGKVKDEENNEQKEQENKTRTIKDKIRTKKDYNKLKLITTENTADVKKTLLKETSQTVCLTYEGEKNKTELLNELVKNGEKTTNLKLPDEIIKNIGKTPAEILQNCSILNRLEQAFMVLGTPNFPDEKPVKTKQDSNKKESSQNACVSAEKVPEKKEQELRNKSQNLKNNESSSNKKTSESSTKTKANENESVFQKKKQQYLKFPFQLSLQLKEGGKKEPEGTENTNEERNKIAEETLERKGTFDVIPVKNSSIVEPQKSKSCNKIDNTKDKIKKRFYQTKKQQPDLPEKQKENETKPQNEKTEKKEEKPKSTTLKNQPKPTEKVSQVQKSTKSGLPKLKFSSKYRFEKTTPTDEVPKFQQIQEKKELNQNSTDRPVKERSILSIRRIQPQTEKLHKAEIEEEKTTEVVTSLKSNTGDMLMKIAQKNYEELVQKAIPEKNEINSVTSFSETDVIESQSENSTKKNSQMDSSDLTKRSYLETSDKITSASSLSQNTLTHVTPTEIITPAKHSKLNHLSSWERDIYRYREIVNDIMNHYKRIDGFLKHSEHLGSSHNMVTRESSNTCFNTNESTLIQDDSHKISLEEYRKKIEMEYQKLPFFEYKQQKREEIKKRNLSVVTDIKKEMDFDVKDFQPNIKKVLDSQLYVDADNLFKQKEFKDKKASLQEITWDHNNRACKKLFLRSNSVQKTLFMPDSEVYSVQSLFRRDNP